VSLLDVFTYYRGLARPPAARIPVRVPDIDEVYGVACTSHLGRHFITQRAWRLDETSSNGHPVDHWSRRDTV
jgi:hypothetical protein